jgi:hypothetical protein
MAVFFFVNQVSALIKKYPNTKSYIGNPNKLDLKEYKKSLK